jgi:hypothetical protein
MAKGKMGKGEMAKGELGKGEMGINREKENSLYTCDNDEKNYCSP